MKTEELLRYDEEVRAIREALGTYDVAFDFEVVVDKGAGCRAADHPDELPRRDEDSG